MARRLSLPEVAARLEMPIQHLLQWASDGEITLSIVSTRSDSGSSPAQAQWADLLPADILSALNRDSVLPTGLVFDGTEVKNTEPVSIGFGAVYVPIDQVRKLEAQLAVRGRADNDYPFLRMDHPNYAPELAIAVEAWLAICGQPAKLTRDKQSEKARIETWLRKHHDELSKNQRARIATVANPNKRGGAPIS